MFISVALSSNALRPGNTSASIDIAPAVIGLENEVPLIGEVPSPVPTAAVSIAVPGAVISGLSKPSTEGPREVKVAIAPSFTTSSEANAYVAVSASIAVFNTAPSSCEIITELIVTSEAGVPPIVNAPSPATLFATTTKSAPAACALSTLVVNAQPPRSINAIESERSVVYAAQPVALVSASA